jgi:predicted permease
MRWLEQLRMRLRMLVHRGQEKRRLDAELSFHLDQQIAENIASGMTPDEARSAALRAFGNPGLLREQSTDTWSWNRLELIWQSLRIGSRTLFRTPVFALVAIVVIAIGIGANVALFTVVRSILLKPLPFKDPSQLMRIYEQSADGKLPYNTVAAGIFTEWQKQDHSFADLALLLPWPKYNLSGAGGQLPERARAARCTWNLFPTLGVEPALGRGFTAEDDRPSANGTVILTWGLCKRCFGGDPAILGQTIHLDAQPYTVIGVMPQSFTFPEQAVQFWTPVFHEYSSERMRMLDSHMFTAIGRLKPSVSQTQAVTGLSMVVRRLHDQNLDNPFISIGASILPLLEDVVGDIKTPLYVLLAATGCVLLIACLNVANLLVARSAARRREIAIRSALGSSRWRLVGEQLVESFLLSIAAGALGLMLAYVVIRWLVSTRQDLTRVHGIHIDAVVGAFTLGLIFLCAVFAGLISSVSASGDKILSSLQESSRSSTGGQARARLRQLLLSLEVGLTVVLLISGGLLLKSYRQMRTSNLGCITNNVLTMNFSLPESRYSKPAQRAEFFETLLARVRNIPGVQAAGFGAAVPGQGYYSDSGFLAEEHAPLPVGQSQSALFRTADPGYFAALGIPFLRGETFAASQRLDRAMKVVINDSFARQYFPGENPVGKHLLARGEKSYEIVGVVGDTRYLINKPPLPTMYFPLYDGTENDGTLAVRSSAEVSQFALPIQRIVQELDHDLAVSDVLTMDQIIGKSTVDASFEAMLLLAFAVLSLILAAVGLFGVLSYIVAQRTTEIGIRVALGAQRESVLRLVLVDGLRPALLGLALGIAGSVGASQLIRSMLYDTRPLDPSVFFGVAAILLCVACAACLIPAWRASRLDPMAALRTE